MPNGESRQAVIPACPADPGYLEELMPGLAGPPANIGHAISRRLVTVGASAWTQRLEGASMPDQRRLWFPGQAVVIGGGIGGLTAARVLADHFEGVVLVEAGVLPPVAGPRGGLPQARHVHGMLARGARELETLFPGLQAELIAAGCRCSTTACSRRPLVFAGRVPRTEAGVQAHGFSRDLLEWSLRQRVVKQPRVTVRDRSHVTGLCWNGDATRVAGVRLAGGEVLDAALVVDASGRFSKLPQWLVEAGYPRPAEKVVDAGLAYATCDGLRRPQPGLRSPAAHEQRPRPAARHLCRARGRRSLGCHRVRSGWGDHPPTDERAGGSSPGILATPILTRSSIRDPRGGRRGPWVQAHGKPSQRVCGDAAVAEAAGGDRRLGGGF